MPRRVGQAMHAYAGCLDDPGPDDQPAGITDDWFTVAALVAGGH